MPTASNVLSKNGYVHELDGWLPVWEPEQTAVLWDLADYTAIKNMVDPESYQPAEPTQSEKRTRVATATCFEYEMGESGSKNTSYSDIDYVTCTSNMKRPTTTTVSSSTWATWEGQHEDADHRPW